MREAALLKINKTRNEQHLLIDDSVYIKNYSSKKLEDKVVHEPYQITSFVGRKLVKLKDSYGKQLTRSRKDVYKLQEL